MQPFPTSDLKTMYQRRLALRGESSSVFQKMTCSLSNTELSKEHFFFLLYFSIRILVHLKILNMLYYLFADMFLDALKYLEKKMVKTKDNKSLNLGGGRRNKK